MTRSFDAIAIGSGLGGLTAAALCARSGLRVLVLERNDAFGGAATVYRHNGLAIESSLHEIDGFDADDPKLPLIRVLGLEHDLQFIDVGDLYEVRGGPLATPFVMPHGADAALAAAVARFPQQKTGLEEYFRRLRALRGAVSFAAHHREDRNWWLLHAPEAVRALWPLLREGSATLGDVLAELFGDDEAVKLALAANIAYYHDDPDRLLFLRFAIPQASYLIGGGHYVRGGSQSLTDRLVTLIKDAKGELETGREANGLIIEGGRVAGVRHVNRAGTIFKPTWLRSFSAMPRLRCSPPCCHKGTRTPFSHPTPTGDRRSHCGPYRSGSIVRRKSSASGITPPSPCQPG